MNCHIAEASDNEFLTNVLSIISNTTHQYLLYSLAERIIIPIFYGGSDAGLIIGLCSKFL